MDEALFGRLAARLADTDVVLASVLSTRGATPRKRGARMLIGPNWSEFSIGGGLAEARVLLAARALLERQDQAELQQIDLTGGSGSAGVCGGSMLLALRRWSTSGDGPNTARAAQIAAALSNGRSVELSGDDVGDASGAGVIHANARLLIVGGGHCGAALCELAKSLDFDLWLFDPRPEFAQALQFPGARALSGDFAQLRLALETSRDIYAVLLNRDFHSDVNTLRVLAGAPFAFLGMMGSRKRIAAVRAELSAEDAQSLAVLQAPVGMEIGAQTPHEIAISVLAHLIQTRALRDGIQGKIKGSTQSREDRKDAQR